MQYFLRKATSAFVASLAMAGLLVNQAAAANCGLTGNWHYNAFLGFGGGQSVVDCTLTIKGTGAYTGVNCGSWITGQASTHGSASGVIKADANCKLSGVIKVAGFADTVIRGGLVSGNYAVLVGVRGNVNKPTQVRLVTLIRE